jgi:hypothetical protein
VILPRGKKRPDLQRWFDAEADPGLKWAELLARPHNRESHANARNST